MSQPIHNARERAQALRYTLIGELLRLEVLFAGVPYSLGNFEDAMKHLDRCENDLIEAKIHALNKQLDYQQEAAYAPVKEDPRLPDEIIYILNCAKIQLS